MRQLTAYEILALVLTSLLRADEQPVPSQEHS